jgi:hypothetical protein
MKSLIIAALLGIFLFNSQAFADNSACPRQGKHHFDCSDQLAQ